MPSFKAPSSNGDSCTMTHANNDSVSLVVKKHVECLRHIANQFREHPAESQSYVHRLAPHTYASFSAGFGVWWSVQDDTVWTAIVDTSLGDTIVNAMTTLPPGAPQFAKHLASRLQAGITNSAAHPWASRLNTMGRHTHGWTKRCATYAYSHRFELYPSTFYEETPMPMMPFMGGWTFPFEADSPSDTARWFQFLTGQLWPNLNTANQYAVGHLPIAQGIPHQWYIANQVLNEPLQNLLHLIDLEPSSGIEIPFCI